MTLPWKPLLASILALAQAQATSTPPKRAPRALPPEVRRVADEALAMLQKKAYAEALPRYEQALALAPQRPELWNEYAICLRNLRRFPASVRAGWRALQLDQGRTPQLWNAQANTFMETRAWKAAEACLTRLEAVDKDKGFVAHAWLNLAFRQLTAREPEGAVAHCLRATQLAPEDSLVWLDLGQAQACIGGDPKAATASLEKGLTLAQARKDAPRTAYAQQLLKKVQDKVPVWPPFVVGQPWQMLPEAWLNLPTEDASALILPPTVEHRYALPDGKALCVAVPETWSESFDQPRPDNLFTIQFTPPAPAHLKVYLSPLKAGSHPEGMEALATKVAQLLQAGSVEKELKPEPFAGPAMKGFRLVSTNRKAAGATPVAGEHKYQLSAFMTTRDQACVATVLSNSREEQDLAPCLAALRSLTIVP